MTVLEHVRGRRFLIIGVALAGVLTSLTWSAWDKEESGAIEGLSGGEGGPSVEEGTFAWVYPDRVADGGAMDWHPAVFLGREKDGEGEEAARDLFAADFKVTSDGRLRDVRRITNLSRTALGDERGLASSGTGLVAVGTYLGDRAESVLAVDFAGEPPELTADWSTAWKWANRITNLQRTGRAEGLAFRTLVFREPRKEIELSFDQGGALIIRGDELSARVVGDEITGGDGLAVQEMVKGRPAPLAWMVDTVRAHPWVGRRKIEWLEKYWFDLSDWLARTRYELVGDDEDEDKAVVEIPETSGVAGDIPGWPPAPMKPLLDKPRSGEGVWIPVGAEVSGGTGDGPPLFYETFWRGDPERPFAKTHMVAWDPSFVEMRMQAGVREPISTTGFRGAGEIPREEVPRLVAAFNGAFQALHGEWGMALDRKYVLPPRSYGATIALYDDSTVGFGTWPNPVGEMPEGMRDLRQNVHPIVEDGVFNPYERKWWGGVPEGVDERVITVRSGICLTFGGKVIYFWGGHQSPESLGGAMVAAGCDYGVHLDMNAGHCGFEFYHVEEGDALTREPRDMDKKLEAVGTVPRRQDLSFRAKKLSRDMGHMRFPRYLSRDPRDFFYLLRRPTIFEGAPGANGEEGAVWKAVGGVEGQPVAMVETRLDGVTLRRADVGQLMISTEDSKPEDALLALPFSTGAAGLAAGWVRGGEARREPKSGAPGLDLSSGGARWAEDISGDVEEAVQGLWPSAARLIRSDAALGFDERGYLVVATGLRDGESSLGDALGRAGVTRYMALIPPSGGDVPSGWLVFRRHPKPAWRRIFGEVEPVPPEVWREVFRSRGRLLDHGEE